MNIKNFVLIGFLLSLVACNNEATQPRKNVSEPSIIDAAVAADLSLVFISCNDQERSQPLWNPISKHKPDVLIWGGDNIYADTEDMSKMKSDYQKVTDNTEYAAIADETMVLGTWDDHDYGKNDAGVSWEYKDEAQSLLLDFLGYPDTDSLRKQEGVYHSRTIKSKAGSVKIILLDTRYFRTALKESTNPNEQYISWPSDHDGTILGQKQWQWLEQQLNDDSADFTVVVSSIQFLSENHGWEKWGNFPSEKEKMYALLKGAKAKNILFLSGDRHMAEVSVDKQVALPYPLVDFTSSGLTHTWIDSATEANVYRVSNVVKRLNFGLLLFDFETKRVRFQIRGENNFLYEEYVQQY